MSFWDKLLELIKKLIEKETKPKPPAPQPEPPKPEEPDTPPQPKPMPNPETPEKYRRGFLWKPIGDGGRPLVVLLPSDFTFNTTKRMSILHKGAVVETSSRAHNGAVMPNGNREHYRFSKRGESYPSPMDVQIQTTSGVTWNWRVVNTAARNDSNITPTVIK